MYIYHSVTSTDSVALSVSSCSLPHHNKQGISTIFYVLNRTSIELFHFLISCLDLKNHPIQLHLNQQHMMAATTVLAVVSIAASCV